MPGRAEAHIVVAGSGVLGSVIALALAQEGARVTLADPARLGDNASGVAAGMLAPAFEAILDPAMATHFDLLKAARDLWPDFVGRMGAAELGLRRCGAIWVDVGGSEARASTGMSARYGRSARGRNVCPPIRRASTFARLRRSRAGGLRTAGGLAIGRQAARPSRAASGRRPRLGVAVIAEQRLVGFDAGAAAAHRTVGPILADAVVLATGAGRSDLAPELAHLSPIKGHILTDPRSGSTTTKPIRSCAARRRL